MNLVDTNNGTYKGFFLSNFWTPLTLVMQSNNNLEAQGDECVTLAQLAPENRDPSASYLSLKKILCLSCNKSGNITEKKGMELVRR